MSREPRPLENAAEVILLRCAMLARGAVAAVSFANFCCIVDATEVVEDARLEFSPKTFVGEEVRDSVMVDRILVLVSFSTRSRERRKIGRASWRERVF